MRSTALVNIAASGDRCAATSTAKGRTAVSMMMTTMVGALMACQPPPPPPRAYRPSGTSLSVATATVRCTHSERCACTGACARARPARTARGRCSMRAGPRLARTCTRPAGGGVGDGVSVSERGVARVTNRSRERRADAVDGRVLVKRGEGERLRLDRRVKLAQHLWPSARSVASGRRGAARARRRAHLVIVRGDVAVLELHEPAVRARVDAHLRRASLVPQLRQPPPARRQRRRCIVAPLARRRRLGEQRRGVVLEDDDVRAGVGPVG